MKVVDIMTPNPFCVTPEQPLLAAAAIMHDHDVGVVPVVEDRTNLRPIGVITDRDLAVRHIAAAHHHDCPCRDAMSKGPLACVEPSADVSEVLRAMTRFAVKRVLVTEPKGRLVGIVAEADLLRHAQEIGAARIVAALEQIAQPVMLQR